LSIFLACSPWPTVIS